MLTRRDFDAAFKQGRRLKGFRGFGASVRPRDTAGARLGLTAPRKVLPLAVSRNRFKRICRESFRCVASSLPDLDIVIVAQRDAGTLDRSQLARELERLWSTVRRIAASA